MRGRRHLSTLLAPFLLLLLGGVCQGSSFRAGKVLRHLFNSQSSLHDELGRALGLSPPPYLKKFSQMHKMQKKGILKNPDNPIKAIQKQLGLLPSITAAIAEKKEEALHELKARLLGEPLPAYPRYTLPPLTSIIQVKQQEALEDLSIQLKPLLGDSGMMDSNLVGSLVPSVARLVEEPDLLPALVATVSRHLMNYQNPARPGREAFSPTDNDRKPVRQLIEDAGFAAEEHTVVTDDGYLLTIHRIIGAGNGPKPVVFLQHGLLCSSADWVIGDRAKAFGFLLADAGYDVWLGNFRGNMYSRNHTHLDPNEEPFWKFSWDQMGRFDLPAMLDRALEASRQEQLIYVGHSMGTTSFWVMMNWRPWMNQKVRLMVGMAPVAAVPHMYSPLRYLTPVARELERVLSMAGQYEFAARDSLFSDISETLCHKVTGSVHRNQSACAVPENIIFAVAGFDAPQMNFTLLPVILGHTPAGTSSRTVLHFAQGVQSGRFREFDFGSEDENMDEYGSPEPPEYSLSHVSCPVVLYWGSNDWLTQPQDVDAIANQLPGLVASNRVPYDSFNHLDFLWAKDADSLLYKPAMEVMSGVW